MHTDLDFSYFMGGLMGHTKGIYTNDMDNVTWSVSQY